MKLLKSFSMAMIFVGASVSMIAQANVLDVDESNVSTLEASWIEAQQKSVTDNMVEYQKVAILADNLNKQESQEVINRAAKVQSEVQSALRGGYVNVLSEALKQEFGDSFNVEQNRNGIALRIESDVMDADVARYLSDKMYVQDEAFSKDFRKIEFVNAKTGFVEVVQNYKIPRVAS